MGGVPEEIQQICPEMRGSPIRVVHILLKGYVSEGILRMGFPVRFHDEFDAEFAGLPEGVQDELLARMALLREYGPRLGRPHADTLKGSRHANLKELRFRAAGGVWRVTYAFDPKRQAIVLMAGDKSGVSGRLFYERLISRSDERYDDHLSSLKEA